MQIDVGQHVELVAPILSADAFSQLNGGMSGTYPSVGVRPPTAKATTTDNGLLGALVPFWQLVIGTCVLITVVAASARLARRGRSRMTTALLVTGTAAVVLAVIGVLTSGR
jgi:hypothetical protein